MLLGKNPCQNRFCFAFMKGSKKHREILSDFKRDSASMCKVSYAEYGGRMDEMVMSS